MPKSSGGKERDWFLCEGYFGNNNGVEPYQHLEDRAPDLSDLEATIATHLDHSGSLDSQLLADFLWKRQSSIGTLHDFWSKADVSNDLADLKRHLTRVRGILEELPPPVIQAFFGEATKEILGRRTTDLGWGPHISATTYLSFLPGYRAYQDLFRLKETIPQFYPLIDAAEEFAKTGVPVGKKNIDAWRTVQACVDLCTEVVPGIIRVPKRMGSSGPFYRFLCDVFLAFGHEEDPEASFRGWRRYVDSKGPKT